MKFSLCLAAAVLLIVSNGCSAVDENTIFENYERGWKKFSDRFLLSKFSWKSDKLDTVAEWLCPASSLFELKMTKVVSARNVDIHHTSMELVNENNATTFNPDSSQRTLETTEFRTNVEESIVEKTSTSVSFQNEIAVDADYDAETTPRFYVRERIARSARQDDETNIIYEQVKSGKRLITTPAEQVTLRAHSQVQVMSRIYKYNTIKNYLLDIELDRQHSLVHWKNCLAFRVAHNWRHLFSDYPSNFMDEKVTNHVIDVTNRHQSEFSQQDGRIEYHGGKMIVKNVPVQIVYTMYKVDTDTQ